MARNSGSRPRMPKLLPVWAVVLVVAVTAWWMMSSRYGHPTPGEREAGRVNGGELSLSQPGRSRETAPRAPARTMTGSRALESTLSEEGEDGPQFPLVDQILADERLSNEEAAARLLEIASNKDLSTLEREEALAHGLNLDFPRFLEVVSDTRLPQPMAQRFFDEMLNYNEHRALQVKASILLMDHEDAAMREEAAEQLAFYIGLEEYSDKPEELKQEAYAFLEDLANRPSAEPEPVDPDADIPETEPINPLANEEEDDDKSDQVPDVGEP